MVSSIAILSLAVGLCVAFWLGCSVLAYRHIAKAHAERQVGEAVERMAREIENAIERESGHVLVNEAEGKEASLLLSVPPSVVERLRIFLNQKAPRVGSQMATWKNDDSVLVHIALGLDESQAAVVREEVDGNVHADAVVKAVTLSFIAALLITAFIGITISVRWGEPATT